MGCHFFSPGYLPDPGIERRSPALQADSLLCEQQGKSVIVEVIIVTANWGLTRDGELCKHFTCIIACNIHSSSPGINAIIPYLTDNKSWEGKGRGREKGRELLPSWQMERLQSVCRASSTPAAPSTTPTVGISSNYGSSPVYESLSCELSKMQHAFACPITEGVSETAACPLSPIADHPSALPSPTSSRQQLFLPCSLSANSIVPVVALYDCTFQGTVL